MSNKLCHGLVCCYTSLDCGNIKCGCMEVGECLCIKGGCCLALGAKPFPCCDCSTTGGECCNVTCGVGEIGLKKPEVLCSDASQFLCFKSAASFPFSDDYVREPVCSFCCLACAPDGGCLQEAPTCPAIERFWYGHQLTPAACKNTKSRTRLTGCCLFS